MPAQENPGPVSKRLTRAPCPTVSPPTAGCHPLRPLATGALHIAAPHRAVLSTGLYAAAGRTFLLRIEDYTTRPGRPRKTPERDPGRADWLWLEGRRRSARPRERNRHRRGRASAAGRAGLQVCYSTPGRDRRLPRSRPGPGPGRPCSGRPGATRTRPATGTAPSVVRIQGAARRSTTPALRGLQW